MIIDFDIEDLEVGGGSKDKVESISESEKEQPDLASISDEPSFGKGNEIPDLSLSGIEHNANADTSIEDSDEKHVSKMQMINIQNADDKHTEHNADEKHAFSVLEKIVKNAIGFNSDNLEEIQKQQKENQEIEDMFSPDELGGTMSDDTLNPNENENENLDSEIELNAGEADTIAPNDSPADELDSGMDLNFSENDGGVGEDLGLEDLSDVTNVDNSSDGDLEMPTDLDMGELDMGEDAPTQDISFEENGGELELGDDSDLGLDLEGSSGDETQSGLRDRGRNEFRPSEESTDLDPLAENDAEETGQGLLTKKFWPTLVEVMIQLMRNKA